MADAKGATERFKAGEIGGLVPAMVEASDADATTGEIMGVLKDHLGGVRRTEPAGSVEDAGPSGCTQYDLNKGPRGWTNALFE